MESVNKTVGKQVDIQILCEVRRVRIAAKQGKKFRCLRISELCDFQFTTEAILSSYGFHINTRLSSAIVSHTTEENFPVKRKGSFALPSSGSSSGSPQPFRSQLSGLNCAPHRLATSLQTLLGQQFCNPACPGHTRTTHLPDLCLLPFTSVYQRRSTLHAAP